MTARLVASGGAEVTVAAAAGLLAIGSHHGGALAPCMEVLEDVVERHQRGATLDDAAREVVAEWRQKGERVPGFGHRVHTADPRVPRLFGLTDDLGKHSIYQDAAWAVERALNDNPEKIIPMNLDGAIAAVLCGLGFPLGLANSLFIVSRFVGLNAQAHEEKTRMRPMRKIQPDAFVWDGAETRNLEESDGDGA
jgi:citrate synthase